MNDRENLEKQVMLAASNQGVSSVLFRNAIGRKLGLNVSDNECMSYLAMHGGTATPTALARYTGLTTGSTTAMLDRLQKAGFIKRGPNPNDRRGVLIKIDKKWGEVAGPLVVGIQAAHSNLIGSYSDDQLNTIIDFLVRFTSNIKEYTTTVNKVDS